MFELELVSEGDVFASNGEFKFSATAGIFKAWPLLALLSPEGPPASHAGLARGRCECLPSFGGHWVEPDRKNHQGVQNGEGYLEWAGPSVGSCCHVVRGSACQEGKVDVVQWALGSRVGEELVQSDEAEEDGN